MSAILHAYHFPRWKHPVVRQCFPGRSIVFLKPGENLPADAAEVAVWGKFPLPPDTGPTVRVLRLEDGFLRSVGLGADIVKPLSWVVDDVGIYYDATAPSRLETLLAETPFDEAMLARAARLRARIVAAGVTKYNVGAVAWHRPPGERRVILVPGQVESDASLAWGAPGERTNIGLLRTVRQQNPDAYLLYKPHPDVAARLRLAGQNEALAADWCDEVLPGGVPMGELLNRVDEVQVLTSLAGFEALLRGKPVTCHGQPFYSGWGLTHDVLPHPRRQRCLSLDALVVGALIAYPLYLSRDGLRLTSPEAAVDCLADWRKRQGGADPWWQEIYRFFVRRIAGVR